MIFVIVSLVFLGFEGRSSLKILDFHWILLVLGFQWGAEVALGWALEASGGLEAPKAQNSLDFLALLKSASSPEPEPVWGAKLAFSPERCCNCFFFCNTSRAKMPVYMKMCSGSGEDANCGVAKEGSIWHPKSRQVSLWWSQSGTREGWGALPRVLQLFYSVT